MEPVRDAPWAEHEKVYLLAEIMKTAQVPSNVLFGFIRDSQIQPKWEDIALPQGRSLRSCQAAYQSMSATFQATDYRPRPQLPAPIMYPGPERPQKRPLQPESSTQFGRVLQPRPPHSYAAEYPTGPMYPVASPVGVGEPANKKKRGRPTKAEAQARADAAAARGEVYPPPRKQRTSVTAAEIPPAEAPPPGSTTPGPGQAPVAAMTSTTPQPAPTEGGSESTSSKKKRSKPTPLELQKPEREPSETESPSAYGSAVGEANRTQAYSSFTPISAPLPSATESRDRDVRMEGVEESQPRTTTPHSFKDTVGI